FSHAVSFHGFDRGDLREIKADVLIGGRGDMALKEELKEVISKATGGALEVRIATDDDPLNGHEPSNIVNRLAKSGGIQIEQSKEAREQWEVIAKAVARVYRAKS